MKKQFKAVVTPTVKSKVTPSDKNAVRIYIDDMTGEDCDPEPGGHVSAHAAINGSHIFDFSFDIEEMPTSCSVNDIGGFATRNTKNKFLTSDIRNSVINRLLDDFLEYKTEYDSCKTIIFTTVDSQKFLNDALKVNPNFTMVKRFRNSSGKNFNNLYVSNN